MKECIQILWNTLKTTFLNVKLQRLCKSHHLCITEGCHHQKIQRNWRNLCAYGTRQKTFVGCLMDHLKWTVSKWKCFLWSDESKFDIPVGNHGRRVLRAKEEGDLPACNQRSVQKPASLMVWGCIRAYGMGSLHVLEGTVNAERYINVSDNVYFREGLVYFSRTMQNHILQLLQLHGFVVEESGC